METISGTVLAGSTIAGSVQRAGHINVTELVFSGRSEFPSIGIEDKLYIAVDENTAYRFDTEQNVYVCLNDYDAIQSRLREE